VEEQGGKTRWKNKVENSGGKLRSKIKVQNKGGKLRWKINLNFFPLRFSIVAAIFNATKMAASGPQRNRNVNKLVLHCG
jgi:hypothetical protein